MPRERRARRHRRMPELESALTEQHDRQRPRRCRGRQGPRDRATPPHLTAASDGVPAHPLARHPSATSAPRRAPRPGQPRSEATGNARDARDGPSDLRCPPPAGPASRCHRDAAARAVVAAPTATRREARGAAGRARRARLTPTRSLGRSTTEPHHTTGQPPDDEDEAASAAPLGARPRRTRASDRRRSRAREFRDRGRRRSPSFARRAFAPGRHRSPSPPRWIRRRRASARSGAREPTAVRVARQTPPRKGARV